MGMGVGIAFRASASGFRSRGLISEPSGCDAVGVCVFVYAADEVVAGRWKGI